MIRYFACDPLLHVVDVLGCGYANGFFIIVQPGVGGAFGSISFHARRLDNWINLPAGCHGRTSLWVTDGQAGVAVWLLDDFEHAIKQAVLLNNCNVLALAIHMNER